MDSQIETTVGADCDGAVHSKDLLGCFGRAQDAHVRAYQKSAHMKSMWVSGKLKPNGHDLSPEARRRCALAHLGKKRSAETIEKMKAGIKAAWADPNKMQGRRHQSPEFVEQRVSKIRGRKRSAETIAKMSARMAGQTLSAEARLKIRAKLLGKPCESEKTKKGPNHHAARFGLLRDPRNVVRAFRNLSEFIRQHAHLFDPVDVIWRNHVCRARKGLGILFESAKPAGSWKGWTRVSIHERRFNDGNDLLARDCRPNNSSAETR